MYNKINAIENKQADKLDDVLRYMKREELPIFQTGIEIANGLRTLKSEQTELYLILNKLVKDEFVEVKEVELPNPTNIHRDKPITDKQYLITFEGLYQINSGGYQQRANNRHSESIRLGKLELATKANQLLTTRLTILIVFGTLVAAIYYGIEIYKDLHSFFHRHDLYWIWETIPKKH